MKKFLLLIIALCFIASLLFICGTAGGTSGPKPTDAAENHNAINIGVFEPLTGDDSLSGQQEALGIRYANSICPTVDIGGITYDINLIEQDSASDINSAVTSAQALASSDITAVLGSYGSWLTFEGNKVFEKADIPLVGISCSSSLLTKDSKNFFRICYSDSFQSGVIANYAYSINCRKAAVLTQIGDLYSKNAGKLISDEFSKLGGKTDSYDFQKQQENYRTLIDTIKESGVDCVFMDSGPNEAVYFINQARDAGLNCPIIGPASWDSATLLNESSSTFGEVYLASEYNTKDSATSEFASVYSSWLKSDKAQVEGNGGIDYVSPSTVLAYDSYMLVVSAIKTAKSSDPKAVLEAIKTISYKGFTGNITFDKSGETGKKLAYIKTINTANKCFDVMQTNSIGK